MKKVKSKKYKFKGKLWKYKGPAGWHFITLPKALSKMIRKNHGLAEEGWGRLKATASIGKTNWQTAIWYDSKFKTYLLPVKSSVRKSEDVGIGISTTITLALEFEELRSSFFL